MLVGLGRNIRAHRKNRRGSCAAAFFWEAVIVACIRFWKDWLSVQQRDADGMIGLHRVWSGSGAIGFYTLRVIKLLSSPLSEGGRNGANPTLAEPILSVRRDCRCKFFTACEKLAQVSGKKWKFCNFFVAIGRQVVHISTRQTARSAAAEQRQLVANEFEKPNKFRGRSSGVEHNLAKVGVVGSNPIARSIS